MDCSNTVEVLNFFEASHLHNCINCIHNCKGHSLFLILQLLTVGLYPVMVQVSYMKLVAVSVLWLLGKGYKQQTDLIQNGFD